VVAVPFPTSREALRLKLASHAPSSTASRLAPRRAAVAAILRWTAGEAEVLLMERAQREGDRWSGQVSMPGGRNDPGDRDLIATAVRETDEEVGVRLAEDDLIGRLDDEIAVAKGKVLPMSITPFVFAAPAGPVELRLSAEATEAFWFPLSRAEAGELDGKYRYELGPVGMEFPCWRWDGHVVWGLTHRMLRRLCEAVSG
jgi:8-oxo-dGTP pyrophosphatase MutT (NUDIX family)